ncbi:winged helix-turn-helix domain-containing protein [Laribacter hongkongensis]|uniref:winged helix-turn-helix domain-containing protein n=1 Tax=Laribacter hongkongensis TaxID=168471 RepID=UPI0027E50F32|nr:winged helix-turn-helix domain-containing protein [Laribacter hongkongensis]
MPVGHEPLQPVVPVLQLLGHIHDDHRIVSDRTVDSHIKNLRKKLAQVQPDADPIRSVYGVGYKFEP